MSANQTAATIRTATLRTWLATFSETMASGDPAAVADLFVEDGSWRDLLAFTWNIKTLEGIPAIRAMLAACADARLASAWRVSGAVDEASQEGFIEFETALGRCDGYVRVGGGKCLTLLTRLKALKGFEEPLGRQRPLGAPKDASQPSANWKDLLDAEARDVGCTRQPYVLVIGGGQGGLGLAARLRMLKVPTLVVDKYSRPGDQWRSRYKSLSLHDPVWYDHMPYIPFPEHWPVFTPKDKIADWLESYAKIMELTVWGDTECLKAAYDDAEAVWRVRLRRDGEEIVLTPRHLVIATGNAGKPNLPRFPGQDAFSGTILHSSQHRGGEGMAGRRVVVVGSNNSAHDICADLFTHGADVTMLQRSSTCIVRSEAVLKLLSGAYSEDAMAAGLTTEKADLLVASMPFRTMADQYRPLWKTIAAEDGAFYARLEAAGFMLDFNEDGAGITTKYLQTASGYYIDVGASEMIADGSIKLRSNVSVDRLEEDGVVLSDGGKVPADVVICATGFGSMDQWAAELISPDVAAKVGKVWGYGSGVRGDRGPWEGELRNMWKPTNQDGLWFHGGNLAQSRFYSRTLALQLKARYEDLSIEVYPPSGGATMPRSSGS